MSCVVVRGAGAGGERVRGLQHLGWGGGGKKNGTERKISQNLSFSQIGKSDAVMITTCEPVSCKMAALRFLTILKARQDGLFFVAQPFSKAGKTKWMHRFPPVCSPGIKPTFCIYDFDFESKNICKLYSWRLVWCLQNIYNCTYTIVGPLTSLIFWTY